MGEMYAACSTIVDLLRGRAAQQPDRLAYVFLKEDGTEAAVSYTDLDRRARAMAVSLLESHQPGERVLLLYPPGLEYVTAFFGCLYGGLVPVPAYPPRMNGNLNRLQAVVADSQARLVLTNEAIRQGVEQRFADSSLLSGLHWRAEEGVSCAAAELWEPLQGDRDTLAFLQYTSGSTSLPKGVMLTHGNLLHNLALIEASFGTTAESRGVVWLPPYHDMGLIGGILQPLYTGYPMTLMAPVDFITRPLSWLEAISRTGATVSGGPNFAYDLCVQKITPEQREGLDLSSWEHAFSGAEPIRAETLERFASAFAACGFRKEAFYPCYGLAEGTLLVAGGLKREAPIVQTFQGDLLEQNVVQAVAEPGETDRTLVSSGRPALSGQTVVIADPVTLTAAADGHVGEIWVQGPSVAKGYWNRPEQSRDTFQAYLQDSGAGPFLRTGDLGFLEDGELYVTGRLKDLIIIRGRNYYPQDVEFTVQTSHPAVQNSNGAAFSVEADGTEQLVIVQEVERKHRKGNHEETVTRITRAVSEQHQLPVYSVVLIKPASIPKTSSGKIQRHACRERFLAGTLEVVYASHSTSAEQEAAASAVDEAIVPLSRDELLAMPLEERQAALLPQLMAQTAKMLKLPAAQLDPQVPLQALGLDSLTAVELKQELLAGYGADVPLARFLDGMTTREAAGEAARQLAEVSAAEVEDEAELLHAYPLTEGQQALFFVERLAGDAAPYNLARAVRVQGDLNVSALQQALAWVVARHPQLRVQVRVQEDQVWQAVQEPGNNCLTVHRLQGADEELLKARLAASAFRPFVLEKELPLRAELFVTGQETVLLLTIHHLVIDFLSYGVLADDLQKAYRACVNKEPLDDRVEHVYARHVQEQAKRLSGSEGERLKAYWEQQLAGAETVLQLPLDRPRPPVQTYRGAARPFQLPAALAERLETLAKTHGATLYTTLLAAFQVLLYRYSGQDDLLVGSPAAGRRGARDGAGIGYYVNPIVLRAQFAEGLAFDAFLEQVKGTVLGALEHAEYPFSRLTEQLQPMRDPSYAPMFQAMFTFQKATREAGTSLIGLALGTPGAETAFADLRLELVPLDVQAVQNDLLLMIGEQDGTLCGVFEYNRDLFDATTVDRMIGHFLTLLEGIADRPELAVAELPLLTAAEKQQLLVEWNDTAAAYPQELCLQQLFAAQVARTPDRVAVVYEGMELTYRELDLRANRLAHFLQEQGAGPDRLVGVCMERSLDMVVALYGIIKAGAAYVPVDPTYPADRIAYMLDDSGVAVVLTQQHLTGQLPLQGQRVVCLDAQWEEIAARSGLAPECAATADHAAYMIYTSGSTGRPKGVLNTHRGIVNRLLWMQEAYALTAADVVLQKTPFSFDVSVWEFFWPLQCGAKLAVARPEGQKDAAYLAQLIEEQGVTTLHFVPSMLAVFLEEQKPGHLNSLRRVICSGEALPYELQERFLARFPQVELHNLYGPTEAAVDVSYWACVPQQRRVVPIGRPISNTQLYVLDKQMQPVPIGVAGELYIGGVQVARGYHNLPELTAERFVRDPFAAADKPHARLYKTGDSARWLADGVIEYLGRLDFQVKIRGFRMELGEIEAVLDQHPAVLQSVVTAYDGPSGDQRLAAYVAVGAREVAVSELRDFLAERLPAFMVPSAFVRMEELPLSPNGKADRKRLPAPDSGLFEAEQAYVAPKNADEEAICAVFAEVLGVEGIGAEHNFFVSGGHSLLGTKVISRLQEWLGIELPLSLLFEAPTAAALAVKVSERQAAAVALSPIEPLGAGEERPLSFAQQRLWVLNRLDAAGTSAYNMPFAVRLHGQLDVQAAERSLQEIVRRHEVLRASFSEGSGGLRQVSAGEAPLVLRVTELQAMAAAEREAEAVRRMEAHGKKPFDLAAGGLFRCELLKLDDQEHVLMFTIHHIVFDGWSIDLLVREFAALYEAFAAGGTSPLNELPVQYADYAAWQRNMLSGALLDEQVAYWKRALGMELPVLHLPFDRPRPPVQTHAGAVEKFELGRDLTQALLQLSQERGVTLFMTLLAAYQTLLHRFSGQEVIHVGTPVAGRTRRETEELIGCFVNTLVMRGDLAANPVFTDLLTRVRETALGAFAHGDVPFEKLVSELQPERDLSVSPLFQTMFALQNMALQAPQLPGLQAEILPVASHTAKFDLTLDMAEGADGLYGEWEYNTDLFDAPTIRQIADSFRHLLAEIAADPARRIGELPLLTPAAERQLLVEWNESSLQEPLPDGICMHHLFEMQAERRPEATAVVFGKQKLTYGELNEQANRLAHLLQAQGAGPEKLVGICVERSPLMVIAALAVHKAGAAYVPIDPGYPAERIAAMFGLCELTVLLTETHLRQGLPPVQAQVVCLDDTASWTDGQRTDNPQSGAQPHHLAYVIFTSGTTGVPKGVMVQHDTLLNAAACWKQEYRLAEFEVRLLQFASMSFDVFAGDLLRAFVSGGSLVICPAETRLDLPALYRLMQEERVTIFESTPGLVLPLMEHVHSNGLPIEHLKLLIVGSDAFANADYLTLLQRFGASMRIVNSYGITETTIDTSFYETSLEQFALPAHGHVPIGRPLPNMRFYVLNEQLQPQPAGVTGELYIAGRGVARGYYQRSDLTAERFLDDPFFDGERMYKTGDVAKWTKDGVVEFLGRSDHQVKIRGFRVELSEIEAVLERVAGVEKALVILREDQPGHKRLVAYVVSAALVETAQLRESVQANLPPFMMPAAFVTLPELPLTPNGKVDRKALPIPETPAEEQDAVRVARTAEEELICSIFAGALQVQQVSLDDHFFELGGDSLLAAGVVSRLNTVFRLDIPLRALFECPTAGSLAAYVAQLRQGEMQAQMPALIRHEQTGSCPISAAQQRMWLFDQIHPGSPVYNMLYAVRMHGPLDRAALEQSLQDLIARHEVLGAVFALEDGRAVQKAGGTASRLEYEDWRGKPRQLQELGVEQLLQTEAKRAFDLAHGPLFLTRLLQLGEEEHIWVLNLHHIVFDGWSVAVFTRELYRLYEARREQKAAELPALAVSYGDYALWHETLLQGEVGARDLAYWQQQLAGELPVLQLPTDRPRPEAYPFTGALYHSQFNSELKEQVKAIARQQGVTVYMVLLAAYSALLHRYTGQEDLLVGSPVAGRNLPELEALIGCFINVLVMRTDLTGNPSFAELLARVKTVTLDAQAHGELPFEELQRVLKPQAMPGYLPLIQTMFTYHNTPVEQLTLPGLELEPIEPDTGVAKFDLLLNMEETAAGFAIAVEYNTALFNKSTVEKFVKTLETLLAAVCTQPELTLQELTAMLRDREERDKAMEKSRLQESMRKKFGSVKPKSISQEALIKTEPLPGGGTLPLVVKPAVAGLDLNEWAAKHKDQVEAMLQKHGGLLFRGFAVGSLEAFEQFSKVFAEQLSEYKERSTPRQEVQNRVYTSTEYPADQHIPLHNESTYSHAWPKKIWFYCVQAAQTGGETPISDSRGVWKRLSEATRETFLQKGVMYVRNFSAGLDLPWQTAFQTEDRQAVEAYCERVGMQYEWLEAGERLRTKSVRPAAAKHPVTGEMLWFNQAHLFHVSSLPEETQTALLETLGEENLPRHAYYGDGTPIEPDVLAEIRDAFAQEAILFPWQEGDILMLDNMMTAHGRSPFTGPRKVVVAMADNTSDYGLDGEEAK